jgi:dephospho-CoA kinase
MSKIINELSDIFEKHKNERICVVGTMCCGKTTLVKQLSKYNCIDKDDEFWCQIPEKDIEILSEKPITKEIFSTIHRLVCEKITVKSGFPLFGVVILDCEVVVYLDIDEKLLEQRCIKRGDTDFIDALFIKKCIEGDLENHKAKKDKQFYYLKIIT